MLRSGVRGWGLVRWLVVGGRGSGRLGEGGI